MLKLKLVDRAKTDSFYTCNHTLFQQQIYKYSDMRKVRVKAPHIIYKRIKIVEKPITHKLSS